MTKTTKRDPREVLAERRQRLARALELDVPDVILWDVMWLVARAQRKVYGRSWHPLLARLRVFWAVRGPRRCECGGWLWWWQETAWDDDLAKVIHFTCGEPAEVES